MSLAINGTDGIDFNLDDAKIKLGAGDDLQIYHDGTDSHLVNATNDLIIQSTGDDVHIKAADDIFLKVQGSEAGIDIHGDAGVSVYYDGSKKFETTSAGATVTGTLTATLANNSIANAQMADDAVGVAELSATGTASSSTFLRGDNAWAAAGGGIDNAVVFRKTADTTGNCLPITDWEKEDGLYLPGEIGTFADPSSGIFTFPSTGYWYIIATMTGVNSGSSVSNSMYVQIHVTIDNGSYWSSNAISYDSCAVSGHTSATTAYLADVEDLSNDKVKIHLGAAYGSEVFKGHTTMNMCHVTFIRLGDT